MKIEAITIAEGSWFIYFLKIINTRENIVKNEVNAIILFTCNNNSNKQIIQVNSNKQIIQEVKFL
jgi:hypothetical protein